MTKTNTKDWRNLPIEQWNANTVHAFLIDRTAEKYNAEYTPGGGGPKSARWLTEKGMIKRELTNRGPATVRKFIEICWDNYFTANPRRFPYPTFGFMLGYMDKHWTDANKAVEQAQIVDETNVDEVEDDWF